MHDQEKERPTDLNEAISVLIQAAELAHSKGVYSMDDTVKIKSAIDLIKQQSGDEQRPGSDPEEIDLKSGGEPEPSEEHPEQ